MQTNNLAPCLRVSVEDAPLIERGPAVQEFHNRFNNAYMTRETLMCVRAHCFALRDKAKADRRELTQDEQTAVIMCQTAERFLAEQIFGIITPADLVL